jgi:hypothetical protein
MNRPKQWGHCRGVYRSLRHPALLSTFASRQMTSSDYLDNTGWSTEFLLYSLRPAMLTNLELDGELDVIPERPCEARFQRPFPIILLVSHLFWRSSARQRKSLALGVGSSKRRRRL